MPFDGQPSLKGTLVELRPLRPDDYRDLYAVASDPLIWAQHPARNRHEEAVFREFFAEALASGGALLITDAEARRVIGSSRFHGYSEERDEVEIGWTFLARSLWGGRYNAEVKRLMLRHAFRFVNSVVFFVSPENFRSQRAMEKIGGLLQSDRDAEGRLVYRIGAYDPSRICPTCRIALVPRSIDSIEIDECARCRYAWVDPEEVAAARRVFPASDRGDVPQFVLATSGSTLECPRCKRRALQLGSIGTRVAHRCSDCGGFWVPLHRGPVADSGAELLLQVCVDLLLSALPP